MSKRLELYNSILAFASALYDRAVGDLVVNTDYAEHDDFLRLVDHTDDTTLEIASFSSNQNDDLCTLAALGSNLLTRPGIYTMPFEEFKRYTTNRIQLVTSPECLESEIDSFTERFTLAAMQKNHIDYNHDNRSNEECLICRISTPSFKLLQEDLKAKIETALRS